MRLLLSLFLALCLFVSPLWAADFTKGVTSLQDWTTLDDTGATPSYESSAVSVADDIETTIHIIAAHQDTNAAGDEAYIAVDISSNSSGDDDWHVFVEQQLTSGTANAGDCDAESASAQANVYVTSTTNFETPGDVYFLKDVNTLADSCVCINADYANDDYITCVDNLANTYDADDYIYDIVDMINIQIPASANRFRVRAYNTDADATYAIYIRYTKVTDIE